LVRAIDAIIIIIIIIIINTASDAPYVSKKLSIRRSARADGLTPMHWLENTTTARH